MSTSPQFQVLYHYTSGKGLVGILTDGAIWASSVHHLNDSTEFSLACGLASKALAVEAERINHPVVTSLAENMSESLKRATDFSAFVACFSEKGDELSQWRGYCPPGSGYSLGFYSPQLKIAAARRGFVLDRCEYNPTKQKKLVTKWARETLASFHASLDGDFDEKIVDQLHRELYSEHLEKLMKFAPFIKDENFRDESEWRIVGTVSPKDPTVTVRSQGTMLIPYVPIDLTPDTDIEDPEKRNASPCVTDIYIGPNPHAELNLDALSYTESKLLSTSYMVHYSEVPFRSW